MSDVHGVIIAKQSVFIQAKVCCQRKGLNSPLSAALDNQQREPRRRTLRSQKDVVIDACGRDLDRRRIHITFLNFFASLAVE
jgi:hypothetical protein